MSSQSSQSVDTSISPSINQSINQSVNRPVSPNLTSIPTCATLSSATIQSIDETLRNTVTCSLFDSNISSLVCDYCLPDNQPVVLLSLDPTTCEMNVSKSYHSLTELIDSLESQRLDVFDRFKRLIVDQDYIMHWAAAEVAMFLYCQHHPIILQSLHLHSHLWKEWVTDTQQLAMIHNSLNDEQQQFFANKWNEIASFAFTTENQQQKLRDWILTVIGTISQSFLPINQSISTDNQSIKTPPLTIDLIRSFITRLAEAQHAYRFVSGNAMFAILACVEGSIIDFDSPIEDEFDDHLFESNLDLIRQLESSRVVPVLALQRDARSGTMTMRPTTVNQFATMVKDDEVRLLRDDDDDEADERPCVEVAFRMAKRLW